ncbi:sugar transferase [Anaerocolumna sp. AGMB13020]|uniref:sugar transferase n=1 Tax=Anaerocolumna sp. AGMB13020 TaxID=3081750 RepID=UPI00295304FC|nr:sugar transferase [Anaerocolumna sp. AGMB13020]WOO37007.1 sugar transferase [Anaerocolumna sp. AGMB13020]
MTGIYERYMKQKIEKSVSAVFLILFCPLLLIIAVSIKLEDGGKVIFTQYRLGKDKKPFKIYKFRTMKENHENPDTRAYQGDTRITRIGRILRKTSLDELPQLFNILKGDMAIVGPRPILEEEAQFIIEGYSYEKRFSVLPGLFCSIDMKYRAAADREKQFRMDVAYVENITFRSDLIIVTKTALTVLKGSNVYADPKDR